MKRLILALAITALLAIPALADRTWEIKSQYMDLSKPPFEPGSNMNPYRVTERYDGSMEIKSKYMNPEQPFQAGTPFNPLIIKPQN